jgi:hypothetical protein
MNDNTKRSKLKMMVGFQAIMSNMNEVDWIQHFERMAVNRCVGDALTGLFQLRLHV